MYSSSNSYLGGGNSGRPGPAYFGPASQYGAFVGQQQPAGIPPQPTTGYGSQGLQPQLTGYVTPGSTLNDSISYQVQPEQQQGQGPAGYPQQLYPNQGLQPAQLPQLPQQQRQQQQSLLTSQQLAQSVLPQRTGQTSSEIAQSFRGSQPVTPQASNPAKPGSKIPTIRLSFITAQDQAKFEQLFKSAAGNGQALSG